jgi:GNAT superfamily N-acetyltransferase
MTGSAFTFRDGDVMAGENAAKVADSLARFAFEEVIDPAAFDEGYRILDAQFGPMNELERREVLDRWFTRGSLSPPDAAIQARYHMLLARDARGAVVAVRDCFTAVDRGASRVVALMSHSLVLPAHRRSGIAALLRASPVVFARRDAEAAGCKDPEILLVAEMEHVEPAAKDTVVRLMAYSRAGFRMVPPWIVPYAQPDFRDLDAIGDEARPIPFILLVRQVGHEERASLAWDRLVAILDGLRAIHSPAVRASQLVAIRAHALQRRDPKPGAEIPLIKAPDSPARVGELAPLLRSALFDLYPRAWHGDRPKGDVEADQTLLVATWKEPS